MNKNEQSCSSAIEGHRKERGTRGYYKLRKAELIHAFQVTRLVEQTSNIFDESIPRISLQFYSKHLGGHQILQ